MKSTIIRDMAAKLERIGGNRDFFLHAAPSPEYETCPAAEVSRRYDRAGQLEETSAYLGLKQVHCLRKISWN